MESQLPRQLRHKWQDIAIFNAVWVPPGVALYVFAMEGSVDWLILGISTVIMLFLSCPIAWLMDLMVPITVKEYGLTSYSSFGLSRVIPWAQIRGAKRMTILPSLTYLAVLDGSWYLNRALIPRFSYGQREFYEDVVAMTGETHPLAVALRREGFDRQPLMGTETNVAEQDADRAP